jgi:CubicO group peptidase (beta-lactamase class C family)
MTIIKTGVIALASALCLAAPGFADGPQTARTVIQEVMEAAPIPAVSVAVHGADGPLYAEAFGQASLELQAPAATAHRFRLGSVAKILTASLAARLADQGVVDLDAPIATYMPDLPEAHRQTSLRQLLGHQGGVRHYGAADYNPMAPGSIIDLRVYPTTQSALALFIEDPLIGEPGAQYAYTTFGYTLIGAVLEAASG